MNDNALADSSWWVYIVECSDGTLYTGVAKNVEKRIAAHNTGRGARYTRARKPVRLVYRESCIDRGDALRREIAIKRLPAERKRRLAASTRTVEEQQET